MPLMREINTPLKFVGIHYYKDEKGVYYRKRGEKHRQETRPFWKLKRVKLGIPLVILLALGVIGYQIVMSFASERVVDEISTQIPKSEIQGLLKDPNIQKMLETEVGTDQRDKILKQYAVGSAIVPPVQQTQQPITPAKAGTSSKTTAANHPKPSQPTVQKGKLVFKTKQEVLKFLLTKFTMSELTQLAAKARDGLTPEEKAEIKRTVLSRLSPQEYNALKIFALVELSKQNHG